MLVLQGIITIVIFTNIIKKKNWNSKTTRPISKKFFAVRKVISRTSRTKSRATAIEIFRILTNFIILNYFLFNKNLVVIIKQIK